MRIAILTSFAYWSFGYSLTGIVLDQARMLTEYGHDVTLFCREKADMSGYSGSWPVKQVLPFAHLADYSSQTQISQEHQAISRLTAEVLARELAGFDLVLTHDLVFTGWNLPYALGIQKAAPGLPSTTWLHWIHSIPTAGRDWWRLDDFGPNHFLVYPNQTDAPRVAEQYHCDSGRVLALPHIKDMRSWADFSEATCRFIREFPLVMQADIVQILPAGQDRLESKRVPEVIDLFGRFKKRGRSVCLVVANQWATETSAKRTLEKYHRLAEKAGLLHGRELVFTSEFEPPTFEAGIPKRMVREIFSLSSLFVFPTHHESFGLVVPEAALSGALMVLNRSLAQQAEVAGIENALFLEFGSYERQVTCFNPEVWMESAAALILGRLNRELGARSRTFARRNYNWDSLYRTFYEPVLAEIMLKNAE